VQYNWIDNIMFRFQPLRAIINRRFLSTTPTALPSLTGIDNQNKQCTPQGIAGSYTPQDKVESYTIVFAHINGMTRTVNDNLKEGWRLYGTPMAVDRYGTMAQCMIKINKKLIY
jgi:hypothetical protein